MTSTDSLILNLSADLAPVKRRSMRRESIALATLGAVEALLALSVGAMRHDMESVIGLPFMIWKIAGLALLAATTCTIAVRSFTPPALSRRSLALVAALAGLVIAFGTLATPGTERGRPLLDRLSPAHGLLCAGAIIVLATPLMAMLAVLMRRAAPVYPRQSALASGLAAATLAALIFTLCCPMNDPLYIIIWYSVAVATVAAAARWLLPRRFRL